jgi:DHA2 family multidrug resistance protein
MAFSLWQMSGFSLAMDSRLVIVSGIVQGLGLGLIFVPLQTLAFGTLAPRFRTTAAALLNLSRNLGGSVGISLVTTLLARNVQVAHADMAAQVTPFRVPLADPAIADRLQSYGESGLALLDAEINRQALMIAFIDDFHIMMLVTLAALPLVILLRKAKAAPAGGPPPAAD